MSSLKDLTNQQCGYVTVIERADDYVSSKGKRHTMWKCQCHYDGCNNTFITYSYQLTSNHTISCPMCAIKIKALNQRKGNEYEFTVDTCIGYTLKGEMFLVDIEDYDKIKDYTWYYDKEGYVRTTLQTDNKRKSILLSRLIMDFPKGMDVDHINGSDTLFDNRKSNLRICSHQLNCFNIKKRSNSKNKYKGVAERDGKYRAVITAFGERYYLGTFETEDEAKNAYNEAAKKLHGEYAHLN